VSVFFGAKHFFVIEKGNEIKFMGNFEDYRGIGHRKKPETLEFIGECRQFHLKHPHFNKALLRMSNASEGFAANFWPPFFL
jgi:hypothetical protein